MLLLCAGVKMRRVAREVGRGLPCAAREQRHGSPSAKGRKAASAGIPCVAPGGSPFARASGGGRSGQRQAWLRGGRLRARCSPAGKHALDAQILIEVGPMDTDA